MGDLRANLKEKIKQSGFPLELWAHGELEKCSWNVQANRQFLDPEEGKPREFDLQASRYFPIGDEESGRSHQLGVRLIIQCKHGPSSSWVFFYPPDDAKRSEPPRYYPSIGQLFVFHADLRHQLLTEEDLGRHHYFQIARKCRSFKEFFPKGAEKLYEAVTTVVKATVARGGAGGAPSFGVDDDRGGLWSITQVYYPVIIYDGHLFTCTIVAGEPELEQVRHVQLFYEYPLQYGQPPRPVFQAFLIDVIHRKVLETFLQKIEEEHKEIAERLGEDISRLEQVLQKTSQVGIG